MERRKGNKSERKRETEKQRIKERSEQLELHFFHLENKRKGLL